MREQEGEFARRNVRIAVVTFENDFFARQYVAETDLAWPLLIDADRAVYRGYGMLMASFWDLWGPSTWRAYLREIMRGRLPQPAHGDIHQRGGDVLIDPAGIVRLHHVGRGPADRPPVDAILQRLGA
ncbi:MAG: redoxin domain-containing protein [Desulfuromonas sp.]|nr:redoxin domain-containing protein [Desulfuromonas sp.]